jgi:UDPglucose--hexose-1-phosphate uridylyltransferase
MKPKKPNPVKFRREAISSRLMTPGSSGVFTEETVPVERRFDPLTGRSCRAVRFSLDRIVKTDLNDIEKRSRKLPCPFCPPLVDRIIPRFTPDIVPEGMIRRGKAFAFPNTGPYDIHGAVIVISDEHFIPLSGFKLETVHDALLAAQDFVKSVHQADSAVKHHFIAWNYMPPSGGSLVHPHLQGNAGRRPTNFQKLLLDSSRRYYRKNGTNYWSDLLEQEKQAGERYIGRIGGTHWLTGFAPRGRLSDILVLFPGKTSFAGLSGSDLHDFSAGLLKVFKYIGGLNLVSFNMSTYSGFDSGQFWAQARIVPRGQLLYSPIETSDQFYYQLMHDEDICILSPEAACRMVKKQFEQRK